MGRETVAAKGSHGLLLHAGDDLPQIAQNSQKLLLGDSLPQISQIYIDGLSAEDSSGGILASATAKCLPQIAQIYTEAANFRGCTCLKCTNIARGAPT